MQYTAKKVLEIIRFFIWWRLALASIAIVLLVAAVTVESGAGWFAAASAVVALVLYGVAGTRSATNHAAIQKLRTDITQPGPVIPPQPVSKPVTDKAAPLSTLSPQFRPDRPDVTIIVTAFNEHRYIIDCLQSIQEQSWRNFECIVIDDCSTDGTIDIAYDEFAGDERFEFVRLRSNVGLAAARNLGISLARSPWITFVDGDDFLFEAAVERRLATLAAAESDHWIAGAYCNWISVPQDHKRTPTGKEVPARPRITWLDALHDAPFIASAPIIRTSIMRALGGFRRVSAAEDADMWTKVLRHGYLFLPTRYTGLAYRQKARSMFRSEILEHASVTTGLYVANYEPKPLTEFAPGAPFPFHEAAPVYITAAESYRRNLIALTTAVAQEDQAAITELTALLDTSSRPYLPIAVDAKATITHAAKRSESYEGTGAATRADILAARTLSIVEGLAVGDPPMEIGTASASLADEHRSQAGIVVGAKWARLAKRQRLRLSVEATGAALADHVVLMPSAAYHVKEFGPLAEALSRRGISVAFMVSDRRWPWTEPGLRAWDFPAYSFTEDMSWTRGVAALVALNDWGEQPHDAIVAANAFGVPTFGKVEGVQDFDDVDVNRTRRAYQTAAHTLCQGSNDRNALPATVTTHIVGSTRLEEIWAQPTRMPCSELAVVNLNFTYGVLTDAREMWIDTVIEAGKKAGIPIIFSLHPAEEHRPEGAPVSDLPISHLLTEATVLVSRFSTVPFEAMARGVPFVYHNPHGEKVPTFLDPRRAYELSTTAGELAASMIATRAYADSYRSKCEAFFRQQIDIDLHMSAADRAAAAIQQIVSGS